MADPEGNAAAGGIDYISAFIDRYRRNNDLYVTVEQEVRSTFEGRLRQRGIKHLFESRVKDPKSLENKLRERESKYNSVEENYADLKDLIGFQVIVPVPSSFQAVEEVVQELVIEQYFSRLGGSHHPKGAPTHDRFRGYHAVHLVLGLNNIPTPLKGLQLEIQINSSWM
jgi:ppGpp synthetase/RelA/SpoT-type nucleotidyltranferase